MNPFETIKSKVDPEIHNKIPKKWKKVGDIVILNLKKLDKNNRKEIAKLYAEVLGAKSIIQKNSIGGELRKPEQTELLYGEETITEIVESVSYTHLTLPTKA